MLLHITLVVLSCYEVVCIKNGARVDDLVGRLIKKCWRTRTDKGAGMKRTRMAVNNKGFTLIELLLVVGIIGVLLAVIIPKAIRANTNAKYGIVEKNAAELKSYAVQWAEKSLRAQDEENSVATLADYYASLTGETLATGNTGQQWIATGDANNWNVTDDGIETKGVGDFVAITGRSQITDAGIVDDTIPEDTVEQMIPPEKNLKNPFNGSIVFRSPNDSGTLGRAVTGALALGYIQEPADSGAYYYFAFGYQGTENVEFALPTTDADMDNQTFHAGMGLATIPGLRNGVLFARIR